MPPNSLNYSLKNILNCQPTPQILTHQPQAQSIRILQWPMATDVFLIVYEGQSNVKKVVSAV